MIALTLCLSCVAQNDGCRAQPSASVSQPKHILGIVPAHNISPCLSPYLPISVTEKFRIATADAFDPGSILVAAAVGGTSQLLNSNRPFGQEASGYGRYVAAAYANHVIGAYLREGVFPSLLGQDPRYFRKGEGSAKARVGYAMSRVFRTRTDSGSTAFNYSAVLGSASTIAASSLYYAHHRDAAGAAVGFGAQMGGLMAGNILKEFWPDLLRTFSRKGSASAPGNDPGI